MAAFLLRYLRCSGSSIERRPPYIENYVRSGYRSCASRRLGAHRSDGRRATSCYRCIQKFQNRRYHGLLDWRAGLAYLRAILSSDFACRLDGEFDTHPELTDWREHAQALAEAVAAMRPSSLGGGSRGPHRLLCITEIAQRHPVRRTVVVHPLWRLDTNAPLRRILSARKRTRRREGVRISRSDTTALKRPCE
jgi:hypothetical protein